MAILNTVIDSVDTIRLKTAGGSPSIPFFAMVSQSGVVIIDETTTANASLSSTFTDKSLPFGSVEELSFYEPPKFSISGILVADSKFTNIPEYLRELAITSSVGVAIAQGILNPTELATSFSLGGISSQIRTITSTAQRRQQTFFINPPISVSQFEYNLLPRLNPVWYLETFTESKSNPMNQVEVELEFICLLESTLGFFSGPISTRVEQAVRRFVI